MRTLSLRSVPDANSQCTYQFLTCMISMFLRNLFKFGYFTLMLWKCVRNICVCSGYASVPDAYAQQMHQFLTRMLRVCISARCICSACFYGTALCARISTWRVCSVHAPFPDSYAQCTHHWHTCMGLRTFLDYRSAAYRSVLWDFSSHHALL